MHKLILLWNTNRKLFIKIIIAVLSIFILIQVLNQIAKKQLQEQNKSTGVYQNEPSTIIDKSSNVTQTESVIDGQKITTTTANENQAIIKSFIEYCNNGKIAEAYDLISDECKEKVLKTQAEFKSKYIDIIFKTNKQYNLQNWYSSNLGTTYKITYIEGNLLATGSTSTNIEDYITVKDDKLNIYRYIGNVSENRTKANEVARVTLIDREIYDEYEIYNFEVSNLSQNTIMINRHEDNKGIYATYKNNKKYSAIISDVYAGNLELNKNQTKYISIKINKMYDGEYEAKKINFDDIINNKENFEKNQDQYEDISKIEIEL